MMGWHPYCRGATLPSSEARTPSAQTVVPLAIRISLMTRRTARWRFLVATASSGPYSAMVASGQPRKPLLALLLNLSNICSSRSNSTKFRTFWRLVVSHKARSGKISRARSLHLLLSLVRLLDPESCPLRKGRTIWWGSRVPLVWCAVVLRALASATMLFPMFVVTEAEAAAISSSSVASCRLRSSCAGGSPASWTQRRRECARTMSVEGSAEAAAVTPGGLTEAGCRSRHSPGSVAAASGGALFHVVITI
jgi:hypothetical protein